MKPVLIVISFLFSIACSSGSGTKSRPTSTIGIYQIFSSSGDDIYLEIVEQSPTAWSELPDFGAVSYEGFLYLEAVDSQTFSDTLIGSLAINSDFSSNVIDGSVTKFVNQEDEEFSGSLAITVAELVTIPTSDGEVAGFDASLAGTITHPTGNSTSYDIEMQADFYGAELQYIYGTLVGQANTQGTAYEVQGEAVAKKTSPSGP